MDNQNFQNQNMGETKPQDQKGPIGPIIGLIIILALILIGGIYYFKDIKSNVNYDNNVNDQITPSTDNPTTNIDIQSASTETNIIQEDLDSFGPDQIDSAVNL